MWFHFAREVIRVAFLMPVMPCIIKLDNFRREAYFCLSALTQIAVAVPEAFSISFSFL